MAQQNLDIVVRIRGGQVASQEIRQVGKATESVGTATESTNKKTAGLSQTLKGVASGIAVYKGYNFIKGAIKTTTDLAKATMGLQRITGMDSKTASGWVGVAKERGVQSKQLNQGFIGLAKNISSAADGSKTSAKAFEKLGLNAAALQAVGPKIAMGELADSFKALPPDADRAALAQKLFGRQAQAMLPLLTGGSKSLNEQVDAMAKHEGMTGKDMKASMELVKQQREMSATMTGVKVAIGTALLPVLTALSAAILPLAQGFATLMTHSGLFRAAVVAVTGAIFAYVAVMALASAANITFLATAAPWIALAVGIGLALVLLYQKCAWFRNAVNAAFAGVKAAFGWIKQAAMDVFNWVKGHWVLLASILGGPIVAAAIQVAKHFGDIKAAAQSVWNFLRGLGQFISGAFAGAWNTAVGAIKSVADAIGQVVSAASKIANLPGKALKAVTGFHIPFTQHGGTITRAGLTVVGEAGPEVVNVPRGASVIPNYDLGRLGGGGGQVVVPVYLDKRQIALAFGEYTADQQAAR